MEICDDEQMLKDRMSLRSHGVAWHGIACAIQQHHHHSGKDNIEDGAGKAIY